MSADQLEAMPQKEMEAYFEPYLNVTRPERQTALKPMRKSSNPAQPDSYAKARQILLDKMGVDLDDV